MSPQLESVSTVDTGRRFEPEGGRPEKLRILHIAEAFGGGVFEMTRILAEQAAANGHEVAIAYGRRPETPEDVRAGVDRRVELFETPWVTRTPLAQVRAALMLRRVVASWRPDVIHLQSSFAGVMGALALRGTSVPMVYSPHGYAFGMSSEASMRRRLYRWAEHLVARRVDLVVAISAAEGESARKEVGAPRVKILENGIPELDRHRLPEPAAPEHPAVIAVGRIRPQRQPEACARILGALRDTAQVTWVGGGDPEQADVHALEAAGVPITGWLTRDGTLDKLADATVYLHWTAWDGLPLSVLEAMARDVVVVASDIPPNRELLGPEQVFDDEDSAVDFIRQVVADPSVRKRLVESQAIRRRHYSAERMVHEWMGVYAGLVQHARP